MRTFLNGLLLSVIVSIMSFADEVKEPTLLEKLMAVDTVRDPEISPDGRYVAYRTFENDFDENDDMSQLWVVAADGSSPPVQLTYGEDPVAELEWSADSSFLAFRRDSKLHFISVRGGEPVVPDLDVKSARNFQFAPDGRTLYFLAGSSEGEQIKSRENRLGKYTVVREDGDFRHIWHVGMGEGMAIGNDPEQLTSGRDFSITGFSVSPDSSQIAFSTWPTPHLADLLNGRIYVLETSEIEPEPTLVDDSYGAKSTPIWHPDGEQIAYTNATGFPTYADIVVRELDDDARTIKMPDHDANLLWFDDKGLQFAAGVRTTYGLYNLDLSSQQIRQLSDPALYAFSPTISRDGRSVAFIATPSDRLGEIAVTVGGTTRMLTQVGDQLNDLVLARKELVTWTNDVGQEIEGVLTKPVGFETGKRYPLYVRTHGGPTGTDRPILGNPPRSIYTPEVLAAEGGGALVLQTNYRGSAGYGNAFQSSNLNNLGIGPAKDIIAGVEMLIEQGLVDPDKVACLGWSQGGHISAMLATYSDICTAAIMGAGISDWRTYYYNTDITQFTTEYFGATPLADDAVYAKTSPVTYIANAKTPVLIQHGENDARVPIANGYQLRQLLLDKGVEARMIVYSGMGHGPSKPKTRKAINEHAISWFREHLFGQSRADFVKPPRLSDKKADEN